MATIYDLKPKFQALLRPFCAKLADMGVTANQVTVIALALSVFYGAAIYVFAGSHILLLGLPVVLFVRMALNAIDGMLAREFGQASKLGAILNELADVLSDAVLYLPFAIFTALPGELVVLTVVLGIIAEMTGVIGVQIGASRRYDGPFGKSDRGVFFGVIAVLHAVGVSYGLWSTVLFAFACALGAATIVNRSRMALKELHDANS